MREGKLDEAAEGFAATVKREPTFAEAHFNLGLVDEELGKYDEAIVSLHAALKLNPRLHGANLFLGIAEFRINNLTGAAAAVQKESTAYPKDANALRRATSMHLRLLGKLYFPSAPQRRHRSSY